MSLRRRQQYRVVWSSSVRPLDRYSTSALGRTRRKGRVRRLVRIGVLLTVIRLMGACRVARSRPGLLAGLVLAGLAVILRDSIWGLLVFMVFLACLPPWSPETA
jgi:hypothetical protein